MSEYKCNKCKQFAKEEDFDFEMSACDDCVKSAKVCSNCGKKSLEKFCQFCKTCITCD